MSLDPGADYNGNLEQEITIQQLHQALKEIEDSSHSYMQTDLQLMMALRTMTQKTTGKGTADNDGGAITCTWAEFLQCYKTVVIGMQTLQTVTGPTRGRAKDRTLSMISLFEFEHKPPATKLLESMSMPMPTNIDIGVPVFKSKQTRTAQKRLVLLYVVLGAYLGAAAVISAGAYWKPKLMVHTGATPAMHSIPIAMHTNQTEGKMVVAVEEVKSPIFAQPKQQAILKKSAPNLINKNAVLELEKTEAPNGKTSAGKEPKIRTRNTLSAAIGGVFGAAGVFAAPVIWAAIQKLPAWLATAGVGGWGAVVLTGGVVVQGMVQFLGNLARAIRK